MEKCDFWFTRAKEPQLSIGLKNKDPDQLITIKRWDRGRAITHGVDGVIGDIKKRLKEGFNRKMLEG